MTYDVAEILAEVVDRGLYHRDPQYRAAIHQTRSLFEVMDEEMTKAGVSEPTRLAILRGTTTTISRRERVKAELLRHVLRLGKR